MSNQEEIIIQRLQKITSWADEHNFTLPERGDGAGRILTLFGKNGGRLISLYESGRYKGVIYAYISAGTFPGELEQRNVFIGELYKNNFIDIDYERPSHKQFRNDKKLQDLTDDELERLLTILSNYCG